MQLDVYKQRMAEIDAEEMRLKEERKTLHLLYAEEHPWNAYKGRKVRVVNTLTGERSEWGYLVSVWPNDEVVGCLLCQYVKADGSRGKKEIQLFFNHNFAEIEVE